MDSDDCCRLKRRSNQSAILQFAKAVFDRSFHVPTCFHYWDLTTMAEQRANFAVFKVADVRKWSMKQGLQAAITIR